MLQIANVFHARLQDVKTFSTDGVQLNAWSIQPQNGNGNAVLLLHGLGDNRFGMAGYAELFLDHGYSVLMPDARAHGNSGGSSQPMVIWNAMTLRSGSDGLPSIGIHIAFTDWGNRWAPRNYCKRWRESRTFARSSPNLHFQHFAKFPTTVSANFFILAHGWAVPASANRGIRDSSTLA